MKPEQRIINARAEAERKAWDSLARYKFVMFGYWAGKWFGFNRICAVQETRPHFSCNWREWKLPR